MNEKKSIKLIYNDFFKILYIIDDLEINKLFLFYLFSFLYITINAFNLIFINSLTNII